MFSFIFYYSFVCFYVFIIIVYKFILTFKSLCSFISMSFFPVWLLLPLSMRWWKMCSVSFVNTEPVTTILGGPDLYIDIGSTINLTCIVRHLPEPPSAILWAHKNQVCSFIHFLNCPQDIPKNCLNGQTQWTQTKWREKKKCETYIALRSMVNIYINGKIIKNLWSISTKWMLRTFRDYTTIHVPF